jgi:hypothetical protein
MHHFTPGAYIADFCFLRGGVVDPAPRNRSQVWVWAFYIMHDNNMYLLQRITVQNREGPFTFFFGLSVHASLLT